MKFIKENLFLVALASATIVLAAVAVIMARSYSAGAREGASARTDLSRELSSLARGPHANRRVVDAEAEKVRLARKAVEEARERLIKRNRGQYRVMTFVAEGKTYPAFPIDKDLYARVGAEYKIAEAYQDEVDALLERLSPTEGPTAAEIDDEIRPDEPLGLGPGPAAAPPRAGLGAGNVPIKRRPVSVTDRFSVRRVARGVGTLEEDTGPTPEEIARDEFILDRALKGKIYANKDESMHMVLLSRQIRYSFQELWFAQVSLWVMRDIVEAIKVTNEGASSPGQGVPVSAVKRLVGSDVLGYVVGQSGAAGAGVSGRPSVRDAASDAAPASVDLQYFTGGARVAGARAPKLTGRGCSQLYDVVHYRFAVVMPIKNLPRLCRNLMEQNYHTVIDVHISATDSEVQTIGGRTETMGGRGRGGERSYYYGTDSVVQVTITGELLLLTDWTRGRKKQVDPTTREEVKGYPELMPTEFLSGLGALDAGALRPEDLERSGPVTAAPRIPRTSTPARPGVTRRPPGGVVARPVGGGRRGSDGL